MKKTALLLVNLGSTASTEIPDVRRYLNQFLMDPYVIDVPWPLRRMIVSFILATRPKNSAKAYESIWWDEGSPLIVISKRLHKKVSTLWSHGPVELAMRYGEPAIEQSLKNLHSQGITDVVVAPLYPHYAESTVKTVIEETKRVIKRHQLPLSLKIIDPFYEDKDYINNLAESAQAYIEEDFDHLLLSYHGLPERHIQKIDPSGQHCLQSSDCCEKANGDVLASCYRAQCLRTSKALAHALNLPDDKWSSSFQSRLGRAKWIGPATDEMLKNLPARGVKKILVICPAFVADCVETLEEIEIEGKEIFLSSGGESLTLIPCLNDRTDWAETIIKMGEMKIF